MDTIAGMTTVMKVVTIVVIIGSNAVVIKLITTVKRLNTIPKIAITTVATSLITETIIPRIDRRRPTFAELPPFALGSFLKLCAKAREIIARTIEAMGATVPPIKGRGNMIMEREMIPKTSAAVPLPFGGASGDMGSWGICTGEGGVTSELDLPQVGQNLSSV